MTHIDPLCVFAHKLNSVNNPARYIGGEYGVCVKPDNEVKLTFAVAFPDLYEIAMSNSAIKIIYNGLNALSGIRCERVFAPDTDFEALLKAENMPLYTLESGIPLAETDIIGFSIGYELGITGVFSILETGRVPIRKSERGEGAPLVIAGGPGVTNPAPFADFFDALFIGEAENELFELVKRLADEKANGAGRGRLLEIIAGHPAMWVEGKKAMRAIWADFGKVPAIPAYFPQASIKPVQDHGVVEIMRGCPNGCRFCHAGIFYRPMRVKPSEQIIREVDELVTKAGYTEISLSSLSSADYPEIETLLDVLEEKYTARNISFQLPSLKVNSMTFPVLEKLSRVRKSGLTFAVETPEEVWQLSLNKEVYTDHLIEIINEAKRKGWSGAKFYFMVGLPISPTIAIQNPLEAPADGKTEEQAIVDFMLEIQAKTRIQCSVNIGFFVPKPHTPYQWCAQILPEEAERKFNFIRNNLPRGRFKVSASGSFTAFLEGIFSRGGKEAGELFLEAYRRGCRLDAWDDRLRANFPIWQSVIQDTGWDYSSVFEEKALDDTLPWADVSLGVTKAFFQREAEFSKQRKLTPKCSEDCKAPCGVCKWQEPKAIHVISKVSDDILKNIHSISKSTELVSKTTHSISKSSECVSKIKQNQNIPVLWRCIFSFSKANGGEFIPHLSMQELFRKAFLRSGISVVYTAGFNPIPRLEFACNLPLGIQSGDEIASCLIETDFDAEIFKQQLNDALPRGFSINRAFIFPVTNKRKRESLASALWGGEYSVEFLSGDLPAFTVQIPFEFDRPFRDLLAADFDVPYYEVVKLIKNKTIAKTSSGILLSYFELYQTIAELNRNLISQ
jgi:radical SAM superfamily enzyme YgiQ (UPF0313 family)